MDVVGASVSKFSKYWPACFIQHGDVIPGVRLSGSSSSFSFAVWTNRAPGLLNLIAAAAFDTGRDEECEICHQVSNQSVLCCDATGCSVSFHPSCAGYPRAPALDPDLVAYCKACLGGLGLKSDDILQQEDEKLAIAAWLEQRDCPFSLVSIEGDGTCMLNAIWTWLQLQQDKCEFKTIEDMVAALSHEAVRFIQELPLSNKERKDATKAWKSIGKDFIDIKRYWNTDALDYTWGALTRLLNWISIDIYQWNAEGGLRIVQSYGEGRDNLTVLCRNRRVLPHYDLLVPK